MQKYEWIYGSKPFVNKPRKCVKNYNYLDYSDISERKKSTERVDLDGSIYSMQRSSIPSIGESNYHNLYSKCLDSLIQSFNLDNIPSKQMIKEVQKAKLGVFESFSTNYFSIYKL